MLWDNSGQHANELKTNSPGLSPERVRSLEQLLFAVSCSESCFLFEQSLIVAGCQGAPGQGHRVLFESRGLPFFKPFVGPLSFTQNCDCWQKTVPTWSQNEVMWSLFFRKTAKTKKCVSTAQACADCMWAHPMERPRRPQNQRKNMTYFRTYFFNQKMQEYEKKGFQKVSKRMRGFPGWRPWGRLGRHNLIFDVKDGTKVLQRCPKVLQKCCQSASRDQKLLKKWSQRCKKCF